MKRSANSLSPTVAAVAGVLMLLVSGCAATPHHSASSLAGRPFSIADFSSPDDEVREASISRYVSDHRADASVPGSLRAQILDPNSGNPIHRMSLLAAYVSLKGDIREVFPAVPPLLRSLSGTALVKMIVILGISELGPEHQEIVPDLKDFIAKDYIGIPNRILWGFFDFTRNFPVPYMPPDNTFFSDSWGGANGIGGGHGPGSDQRLNRQLLHNNMHTLAAKVVYQITGEYLFKRSEGTFFEFKEISDDGRELLVASQKGDKEEVTRLLSEGVDPNISDMLRKTPMLVATRNRHFDIMSLLLQKGAPFDRTGYPGASALEVASQLGHEDVVDFLLARGAADYHPRVSINAIRLAMKYGHPSIVQKLAGTFAKQQDKLGGFTSLMAASSDGLIEIAELLIAKGAPLNAQTISSQETALMVAANHGHAPIVALLISKGADVNASDNIGATALFHARENKDIQKMLEAAGCTRIVKMP